MKDSNKNHGLHAAIIAAGYRLQDFAAAAGVTYLALYRVIYRVHQPNQGTVDRIAHALDRTAADLGIEAYDAGNPEHRRPRRRNTA